MSCRATTYPRSTGTPRGPSDRYRDPMADAAPDAAAGSGDSWPRSCWAWRPASASPGCSASATPPSSPRSWPSLTLAAGSSGRLRTAVPVAGILGLIVVAYSTLGAAHDGLSVRGGPRHGVRRLHDERHDGGAARGPAHRDDGLLRVLPRHGHRRARAAGHRRLAVADRAARPRRPGHRPRARRPPCRRSSRCRHRPAAAAAQGRPFAPGGRCVTVGAHLRRPRQGRRPHARSPSAWPMYGFQSAGRRTTPSG